MVLTRVLYTAIIKTNKFIAERNANMGKITTNNTVDFDELVRISPKKEHPVRNDEQALSNLYGYSSPLGHIGGIGRYGSDFPLTDNQIADFKRREGSIGFDDDITFEKTAVINPPEINENYKTEADSAKGMEKLVKAPAFPDISIYAQDNVGIYEENVVAKPDMDISVQTTNEIINNQVNSEKTENADQNKIAKLNYNESKNDIEVSIGEIVVDLINERFYLLKSRSVFNKGFSDKSNKSRPNRTCEVISKGVIEFIENRTVINFDGEADEYIAVRYYRNHTFTEGVLDKKGLTENPESLYEAALKQRVIFDSRKYSAIIADYLLTISEQYEQTTIVHKGFYIGTDKRLHHPDEIEIMLNSASTEEIRHFLGIDTDKNEDIAKPAAIIFSLRLLSELKALGYIRRFPALVIVAADPVGTARTIAGLLGEDEVYKVERNMVSHGNKKIRVFDVFSSTKYNIEKYLPELINDAMVHPAAFVTNDIRQFYKQEYSPYILVLTWIKNDIPESAVHIFNSIRTIFLRKNINPEEWGRIVSEVDTSDLAGIAAGFVPHLILATWTILSEITDKNIAENYIDGVKQLLISVVSDLSETMMIQLKTLLNSGYAGVYRNRSGNAIVIADVINKWANMNLWSSDFAARFAEKGIISRGELSFQKTATINGKSHRVFEIVQDYLFNYGELRTVTGEFANKKPEIMIPFAECCKKNIYISFDSIPEYAGANIMVIDNQGSVSSNVMNILVAGALEQNINVIIPLYNEPNEYIDEAEHYFYRNNKLYKYSLGNDESFNEAEVSGKPSFTSKIIYVHLSGVLNKKSLGQFVCDFIKDEDSESYSVKMLIFDNTWDYNVALISWFIKKIFRIGSENGIINCISVNELSKETAPFINDIIGKTSVFIRTGNSPLKQIERHIFEVPSGDLEADFKLRSLPDNSCLAVGKISTENGYINDPIIAEI